MLQPMTLAALSGCGHANQAHLTFSASTCSDLKNKLMSFINTSELAYLKQAEIYVSMLMFSSFFYYLLLCSVTLNTL